MILNDAMTHTFTMILYDAIRSPVRLRSPSHPHPKKTEGVPAP